MKKTLSVILALVVTATVLLVAYSNGYAQQSKPTQYEVHYGNTIYAGVTKPEISGNTIKFVYLGKATITINGNWLMEEIR